MDKARGLLLFVVLLSILVLTACADKGECEKKQPEDIGETADETGANQVQAADKTKKAEAPGEAQEKRSSLFRPDLLSFDKSRLRAKGDIDPAVFRRVMNKRKSSFKVCYKRALDKDPKARGEVRIGFNISPTGRVSTVKVINATLKHPETLDCIVRVIRRVQFPAIESGQRVSVEYPLVFSP